MILKNHKDGPWSWWQQLLDAFAVFGGVPLVTVSDNPKTVALTRKASSSPGILCSAGGPR
jgi:hypothetical protein